MNSVIMLHLGGGTMYYAPQAASPTHPWSPERLDAKELPADVAAYFEKTLQEQRNTIASGMRYVNGQPLTDRDMRHEAGLVRTRAIS